MKQVFRTFIVTLLLILTGGVIGGYFYFRSNPEPVYQMMGCVAPDQTKKEMKDMVKTLMQDNKKLMMMVEELSLQHKASLEKEATTTTVAPKPAKVATGDNRRVRVVF